jgi:surface polysaccharide O-acyltransferase-like enzyme
MQRRQDVELLRIVSAFGIVWFHSRVVGAAVAYGGLVVFLILSVYFGGKSGVDKASVGRRAKRLLIPWLLWFAVYAGRNLQHGESAVPLDHGVVAGVMAGPSIHLWYLPFIFLCLLMVDMVKARVAARPLAHASGLLAIAVVAASPLWRPVTLALPYPLLQWADAVGPVAMGLFLSSAHALPGRQRVGICALVLACSVAVATRNSIGVSFAVGFAACAVVLLGKPTQILPFDVNHLSDLSLGIYLSHALIFGLLLQYAEIPNALMPFAIFGIAAVFVALGRGLFPTWRSYWS